MEFASRKTVLMLEPGPDDFAHRLAVHYRVQGATHCILLDYSNKLRIYLLIWRRVYK